MQISGIISVSGLPGLYKVVAKTRNGIIAESLIDQKRIPVYSTTKVSALEDISLFTTGEELPLIEVLKKFHEKEKGGPSLDSKSDQNDLKKYFEEILPEYDKEKVHFSDIKKIFSWYNLLQQKGLTEPAKEETKPEESPELTAKPKKKGAAKEGEKEKVAKPKKSKDTTGAKPTKASVKTKSTLRKTGA